MHSDTPDIRALRAACDEYNAILLVDCAHDLGCIGEDGLGHLGLQNMLDDVDIIVGSFSKTFAANGGFIAVKTQGRRRVPEVLQRDANVLQRALARAGRLRARCVQIVRSAEGKERRQRLMNNILYLREETERVGLETLGDPSAIVPVRVGAEGLGPHRLAQSRGRSAPSPIWSNIRPCPRAAPASACKSWPITSRRRSMSSSRRCWRRCARPTSSSGSLSRSGPRGRTAPGASAGASKAARAA